MIRRSVAQPDVAMVKLKFTDVVRTQETAGPTQFFDNFRANNVYDPRYSFGGTSAQMLSWYGQVYDKYCVMGCKIRVQFVNLADDFCRTVGVIAYTNSSNISSSADSNQLLSQPYCRWRLLGPVASSKSTATMSMYMSTSKIFGKKISNLEEFSAAILGSPANDYTWYYAVFGTSRESTSDIDLSYQVQLTYYVKFYDRNNYIAN